MTQRPARVKQRGTTRTTPTTRGGPPRTAKDRAAAAKMLELLRQGKDVRSRKVRRLRAAIKVSHYENGLKLAIALERAARTSA